MLCFYFILFSFPLSNSLLLSFSSSMQMLSPQVPTLVGYLGNQSLTEALLGALVDVSQASPSSLVSFLPALRILGQQFPAFLAHVAKIHGAVGIISEVKKTPKKHTHTQKKSLTSFQIWVILPSSSTSGTPLGCSSCSYF